ncbi:dTDP-4-dehydrorhamnose reductase [Corynebacterium ciconiae DSM 44920]|uniref:dTDP-4-dehydrorhamnose reductase n=1 Tax=Corynebacterium ciconiae TaxID=227319 RepID=UPI000374B32F|nr:dTDP-4-dehydrorhamnose reductase [Corynebacterium ciconiae]WKD61817.1 dTDP-4-dehydrorhamnose reductase [Corynebacterium ciconiae DSM 44920]
MRITVTGAGGQLGRALSLTCPPERRDQITWLRRSELDITSARQCALIDADLIINTAAFTDVDGAEGQPELAEAVNARGPQLLGEHAARTGAYVLHVSTDYVMGAGAAPAPQPATEDAPCHPETVYGRSKLAGERALAASGATACVVRTAWVFSGEVLPEAQDFVSTMMRLEREHDTLTVVDDQWGNPTFVIDLARGLWEIVDKHEQGHPLPGVLHGVGGGDPVTWCTLAREVFRCLGADPARVQPVGSDAYPRPARRPNNSALASTAWREAGLAPLPEWRSGVRRAVSGSMG